MVGDGAAGQERVAHLKFGIVREDPELESILIERTGASAICTVASGGCTALSLAARFPSLAITAFDVNPRQLQHVAEKMDAAERGDRARLAMLNQAGEFEGLFRLLRDFIEEFVGAPNAFFYEPAAPARAQLFARWKASRYWPAAFHVAFEERFLHAMFGAEATRHAEPGSYPGYFRAAFERGFEDPRAPHNPFLQHIFLGAYRGADAPLYTTRFPKGARQRIELVERSLESIDAPERFQVYSLSNVFDWSDDALVSSWAARLKATARPGSAVLIRQLNNRRDLLRFFAPEFRADAELGAELYSKDRSLFYERITVLWRNG